jgi:hypothetical protein
MARNLSVAGVALALSFQAAGAERDARTAYLKACTGQ